MPEYYFNFFQTLTHQAVKTAINSSLNLCEKRGYLFHNQEPNKQHQYPHNSSLQTPGWLQKAAQMEEKAKDKIDRWRGAGE